MTSFKVNVSKEMLRFGRVTLANLKIGELTRILAPSKYKFSEVISNKFDSKSG